MSNHQTRHSEPKHTNRGGLRNLLPPIPPHVVDQIGATIQGGQAEVCETVRVQDSGESLKIPGRGVSETESLAVDFNPERTAPRDEIQAETSDRICEMNIDPSTILTLVVKI